MAQPNASGNASDRTTGHQPLVAGSGRALDEPGPGHSLRLERVRGAAGKTIRVEARRHLHGIHHRGDGVRAHLRRRRTHPGQDRPVLLFPGGRPAGEPGILPVLVHHQPHLPVHLFRCDRRVGQRLRLRHADSRSWPSGSPTSAAWRSAWRWAATAPDRPSSGRSRS